VIQTKQVQNWVFKGGFSGAYLNKGFNLPTDRVSWTYPKKGANNNQEAMLKPVLNVMLTVMC